MLGRLLSVQKFVAEVTAIITNIWLVEENRTEELVEDLG
jgi:hypothetical protein